MVLPLGVDRFGECAEILLQQTRALQMMSDLMRRRIELDTQYIAGLQVLAEEYKNVASNDVLNGLPTLVLTQLEEELESRIAANDDMKKYAESLPDISEPERDISAGSVYLMKAKQGYQDVMEAKSEAEASKLSLRAWYKKKKYARWDDSAKLPDEDRRYRQSVVTQHRTAEKARSWLSNYPLVVDQHKERVEKLWSLLKQASIANIDLATSLSCHLSTYHDQLEEFSPRAAITPVKEACKEDAESQIARPAAYHNYCIGGVKSPILFGADLFLPENRLEVLISELYRGYSLKLCPWGDLFDIEQTSGGITEYMKLSSDSRKTNVRVVFEFELCHYNPLLPLKREIPSQLLDFPPSRNELASLLDFKLEEDDSLSSDRRRRLAHEISRYTPFFECLAVGQPHSNYIRAFWQKWDFLAGCPLPNGIERKLEGRVTVVKVQKTGEKYYPSHWKE